MILNFGSVNIDNCYQVREFVRAGETISALEVTRHAGGKGFNQSVALARAGAKVCHAGCIGEDGLFLRDMLRAAGVDTDYLRVTDTPTGNAIIQVNSRGENCIILYTGANGSVTKDFADEVLERFGPEDLLLVQNEISSLPYILKKAREKGMRIAFNPSPMNSGVSREMLALMRDMNLEPKDAKRKDLAYAFMNYIYDGDVAAVNMDYIQGPNPVKPGIEQLDAGLRDIIILKPEQLAKGQVLRNLDDQPAVMELYNKTWDKIKATEAK